MATTNSVGPGSDVVLVISLLFLSVDVHLDAAQFSGCQKPIDKWLLVSYFIIIASRIMCVVGSVFSSKESGDFLLNLRHNNRLLQRFMSMTWIVILPLFAIWTLLGSFWLWEVQTHTPQCLPGGVHSYFLIAWQALSYIWIIIHGGLGFLACFLERCVRRVEGDLRQLEDGDSRSRWGEVSNHVSSYRALTGMNNAKGLSPSAITSLPSHVAQEDGEECSICLSEIESGEQCRQLPGCGHTFHRSCVDLWLLRNADCPLCKRKVDAKCGTCSKWV